MVGRPDGRPTEPLGGLGGGIHPHTGRTGAEIGQAQAVVHAQMVAARVPAPTRLQCGWRPSRAPARPSVTVALVQSGSPISHPPIGERPHGRDHAAQGRPRQGQEAPRRSSRRRPSAAIKTRTELFATIKGELTVHEIIEEEIFYPALKDHPKAKDIVLEGYEEHHVVDLLMSELEALAVDDESWGAKAKVMKENIEHHIEEEEGEMFKQARSVFDRRSSTELGERMAARKAQAQKELNIPA